MFFRMTTDHELLPGGLAGAYAGPSRSTCWLIGGGPSLARLPLDVIAASPAPKMGVNLAGTGHLRPTFWTAYDPSVRFHRSIYLDAGVMKLLHRRRAFDLVPETTFKVCECPNTWFFERQPGANLGSWLTGERTGISDWADSLLQAIDLLYVLGFRRVLLAGCDLQVLPSDELVIAATAAGVERVSGEPLGDFLQRCRMKGVMPGASDGEGIGAQYHFDEVKPVASAVQTDMHYYRVVQWLRLSRRTLTLAGMDLVSVTPESRLNAFFPYVDAAVAAERVLEDVGNPRLEPTRGLYTQQVDRFRGCAVSMKDFRAPG
jgi:hypothetical protein